MSRIDACRCCSQRYQHLDSPYVESISFGEHACPDSLNISGQSRAGVSYDVNTAKKRDCAIANPDIAWNILQTREYCGELRLAGEMQIGLNFEPKCLYVVMVPATRSVLFDELMVSRFAQHCNVCTCWVLCTSSSFTVSLAQAAGRVLSDPLNITIVRTLPSNPTARSGVDMLSRRLRTTL